MPTAANAALAQIDAFLDDQEHAQERGLVPAELVTRGLAAIDRAAPRSVYAEQARATVGQRAGMALHGVVTAARALRHDIAGGHVRPLEEIVHAEVFEDFLDMAAELLQGGYASSAAVLAGSVFEEHVRQLAAASGIAPASAGRPVAFDTLATNLTKLTTILETERKAVVAWYGLGPPARMAATPRSLLTTSSG